MNVSIYYFFLLLQNGFRSEQEAACEVMWDGLVVVLVVGRAVSFCCARIQITMKGRERTRFKKI